MSDSELQKITLNKNSILIVGGELEVLQPILFDIEKLSLEEKERAKGLG